MSAPTERMLKLMAYADGELTDAELADVEAMLASDPDAVHLANDLAELGDFVELGYAESPKAKSIASFDIASSVMAKIEATKPDPVPARVASLDAARARQRRQYKVGAAVAAALALAASVFLMTRTKEIPMGKPVAQMKAAEPAQAGSVEVDSVGRSVSVFYLPSDTELTTSVVVWVDETGEK